MKWANRVRESDFRVESNNFTHAVFVDASEDRVSLLSGSGTGYVEVGVSGSGHQVTFYGNDSAAIGIEMGPGRN